MTPRSLDWSYRHGCTWTCPCERPSMNQHRTPRSNSSQELCYGNRTTGLIGSHLAALILASLSVPTVSLIVYTTSLTSALHSSTACSRLISLESTQAPISSLVSLSSLIPRLLIVGKAPSQLSFHLFSSLRDLSSLCPQLPQTTGMPSVPGPLPITRQALHTSTDPSSIHPKLTLVNLTQARTKAQGNPLPSQHHLPAQVPKARTPTAPSSVTIDLLATLASRHNVLMLPILHTSLKVHIHMNPRWTALSQHPALTRVIL